ncbi:uncharacterized protein LOC121793952 [Salvia splendens]|uniref:uncharacterized protein LOC121793952 n=1 Tax=Salvia splendens TaxID=180675 RepID=UPI001C2560F5|nr:uncharacterized protein LOC121793952 [Salvia splendens]
MAFKFSWVSLWKISLLLLLIGSILVACFTLPVDKILKDFLVWIEQDLGPWGPLVLMAEYTRPLSCWCAFESRCSSSKIMELQKIPRKLECHKLLLLNHVVCQNSYMVDLLCLQRCCLVKCHKSCKGCVGKSIG